MHAPSIVCHVSFLRGRGLRRPAGARAEGAGRVQAFFKDAGIRKVWHNYSFDRHVLANMGVTAAGFAGDTMHMARLWNSSRKGKGYTLENLSRRAACPFSTL